MKQCREIYLDIGLRQSQVEVTLQNQINCPYSRNQILPFTERITKEVVGKRVYLPATTISINKCISAPVHR